MPLTSRQPYLVQGAWKRQNSLLDGSVVVYDGVHAHVVVDGVHRMIVDEHQVELEEYLFLALTAPCGRRKDICDSSL